MFSNFFFLIPNLLKPHFTAILKSPRNITAIRNTVTVIIFAVLLLR